MFVAIAASCGFAALTGAGRAAFPGTNGKLVFSAWVPNTAGPRHVYEMGPDGTGLAQLTSGSADDEVVSVAPNGALLVSRDTREQCGHLYWAQGVDLFTLDANGGTPMRVTNNCPADDSTPAWSPSGKHVVFSRFGELWSMRPDGSDAAKLTCAPPQSGPPSFDYSPSWSPDGRLIAFAHGGKIALMNADGTNERVVATGSSPSFSPDGTKLAYAGPVFTDEGGIHVVSRDGSRDRRLTSGYAGLPAWSPDGAKIAFVQSSDPFPRTYAIATMNADGSDVTTVLNTLDPSSLDWARSRGGTSGVEADVTAAQTACPEAAPGSPPAAPPAQDVVAGPAPTTVAASNLLAPDRLTVSTVGFTPTLLRNRNAFTVTVTIRDLAGRAVTGAVVRLTPLRGDARPTAQVSTGSAGVAHLRVSPTKQLHLRAGGRLVLAVHVRAPGDPWAGAISGLRLISVRTGTQR
jgi:hypothetical protein